MISLFLQQSINRFEREWKYRSPSLTIRHHPSPSITYIPNTLWEFHHSIMNQLLYAETSCDIFRWLPVTWTPAIPPLLCCGDGCSFHLTAFESVSKEAEWCRGVRWWIMYFWITRKSVSKNDHTFGKFHHEHPFWEFIYKRNLISTQWCRNSTSTTRQFFVNDQELCIPWPTLYTSSFHFWSTKKAPRRTFTPEILDQDQTSESSWCKCCANSCSLPWSFRRSPEGSEIQGFVLHSFRLLHVIPLGHVPNFSLHITQHLPCLLVCNQPNHPSFRAQT